LGGPRACKPAGQGRGTDGALDEPAVAAGGEFARIDAETIRSGNPRNQRRQGARMGLGRELRRTRGVEEGWARLKHEELDEVEVVLPEVEQVTVRASVSVQILYQWCEYTAEVVPGLDL